MALAQVTAPTTTDLFRVYDPAVDRFDEDGYPWPWSHGDPPVKDIVREQAGNRCVRCGHPYMKGAHGNGEWSPCDQRCRHLGSLRWRETPDEPWAVRTLGTDEWEGPTGHSDHHEIEAQWRILTVHHLDGDKANLRWWNLCSLCQRCHLTIQGKVKMDLPYDRAHSEWFIPYVCGFYAAKYLAQDISRAEADQRRDELLALELRQFPLFNADLA